MTIDEGLEALAQTLERLAGMRAHAAEEYEERQLRIDERFLELAEQQPEMATQHGREIAEIRREPGRAVRLSVQETRNERKRRQELDNRQQEMVALADKRHQELQALLKAFLERGGNGKH